VSRSLAEAVRRLHTPEHPALPRLLMLTDAERLPDPLPAARQLPPGSGIILRHYDSPRRVALAYALARLSRARRLSLLIADDIRLAGLVRATGIHLPEHRVRDLARHGPRDLGVGLVTAAAHSPATIQLAKRIGANAVLLSPVFKTASHPGEPPIGPAQFRRWTRQSPLPVYALGGINARTVKQLAGCGLYGVAAIDALSGR
jgi:thiamine-phosphate pyrophosphorylase